MKINVTFENGEWVAESNGFDNYACFKSNVLADAINSTASAVCADWRLGCVPVCFRYGDLSEVLPGFLPLDVTVLGKECSEGGDQ